MSLLAVPTCCKDQKDLVSHGFSLLFYCTDNRRDINFNPTNVTWSFMEVSSSNVHMIDACFLPTHSSIDHGDVCFEHVTTFISFNSDSWLVPMYHVMSRRQFVTVHVRQGIERLASIPSLVTSYGALRLDVIGNVKYQHGTSCKYHVKRWTYDRRKARKMFKLSSMCFWYGIIDLM